MAEDTSVFNGVLLAVIICLLIIFGLLFTQDLSSEGFIELEFTDYANLPRDIEVGETYSIPFTLTNQFDGAQEVEYSVILELHEEGNQETIGFGWLTLYSKESVNLEVSLTIEEEFEDGRLIIEANDLDIYYIFSRV
jgi:hypothetical protein